MEASDSIVATDLYGKPIKLGTVVRYVTTRTFGKVVDLKKENDKTWAQIESTGLYYDTHYLTVTDEASRTEEDEDTVKIDMAELQKKIKSMEEDLKVHGLQSDGACEGGG